MTGTGSSVSCEDITRRHIPPWQSKLPQECNHRVHDPPNMGSTISKCCRGSRTSRKALLQRLGASKEILPCNGLYNALGGAYHTYCGNLEHPSQKSSYEENGLARSAARSIGGAFCGEKKLEKTVLGQAQTILTRTYLNIWTCRPHLRVCLP